MLSRNDNLSTDADAGAAARRRAALPHRGRRRRRTSWPATCPSNDQDFQLAQCLCTTDTCGAGMVECRQFGRRGRRARSRPLRCPHRSSPGQNVTLNASGQRRGLRPDVSRPSPGRWLRPRSIRPPSSGANTATATVIAPTSGSITLRVTVTDDQGRVDAADVVVEPNRTTLAAPASAGSAACATPVTSGPTPGCARDRRLRSTSATSDSGGGGRGGGGGGSLEFVTLILLGARALATSRATSQLHVFPVAIA